VKIFHAFFIVSASSHDCSIDVYILICDKFSEIKTKKLRELPAYVNGYFVFPSQFKEDLQKIRRRNRGGHVSVKMRRIDTKLSGAFNLTTKFLLYILRLCGFEKSRCSLVQVPTLTQQARNLIV